MGIYDILILIGIVLVIIFVSKAISSRDRAGNRPRGKHRNHGPGGSHDTGFFIFGAHDHHHGHHSHGHHHHSHDCGHSHHDHGSSGGFDGGGCGGGDGGGGGGGD